MLLVSLSLAIALWVGVIFLAAPLEAQTSATLNVTARVVQECTVSAKSKRELVKLARKLNDLSIIRRCSKGVVSRVDKKTTTITNLRQPVSSSRKVTKKRVSRSTINGQTDVVLVTVSY